MGTLRAIAHAARPPRRRHAAPRGLRAALRGSRARLPIRQLIFDGPAADLTDGVLQEIFGDRLEADASPLPLALGALELVPS